MPVFSFRRPRRPTPPPHPSSALPYQITVKWTPPSDDGGDTVTSYNVKWNTNADMMYPGLTPDKGAVAVLATDASSYTIQDLTAGQRYYGTCSYVNPLPSTVVTAGQAQVTPTLTWC